MDIISDQCATGRRFRVLDDVTSLRGTPHAIAADNGPEFVARALDAWVYAHQVQLAFIRPGKPVENAYVESFHDKIRTECLDQHWFTDLHDARDIISAWQRDSNTVRPHSSLQQLTQHEYARTFTRSPQPSAYTS